MKTIHYFVYAFGVTGLILTVCYVIGELTTISRANSKPPMELRIKLQNDGQEYTGVFTVDLNHGLHLEKVEK